MIYSGDPVNVVLEASIDTIIEQDLDTFNGEQFDRAENVIRVQRTEQGIEIESVRSLDAHRRGVPNAGRGVLVLPPESIAAVHINDKRLSI